MDAMRLILFIVIMRVSDAILLLLNHIQWTIRTGSRNWSPADEWEITVSMSPIEATTVCTDLSVTFYEREDYESSIPAPNVTMEISMPSVCNVNIPNIDRPMMIDVWNDGNAETVNYLFEKLTMASSSFHLTFECNCYLGADGSKQTLYPNDDQWEIKINSRATNNVGQYNPLSILIYDIIGISQSVSFSFKRGETTTIEEILHIEEPFNYKSVGVASEIHNKCITITFMHKSTCRTFDFECWNTQKSETIVQSTWSGFMGSCFPTTTTTAAIPPICVCNPTMTPPMVSVHTTYPTTSEGFTTASESTTTTSVTTAVFSTTKPATPTISTTTTTSVTTAVSTTKPASPTISTTTSAAATISTTTTTTATGTTRTPSGSSQNVSTKTTATEPTDTHNTPPPTTEFGLTEPDSVEMSTVTIRTTETTTSNILRNMTAQSNLSCCGCYARKQPIFNFTSSELQMLFLELKQQLTVDKSALSSTIRKKTCAEDNRPTSKAMGMAGAVLLAIPFILMILCDLLTVFGSRGPTL